MIGGKEEIILRGELVTSIYVSGEKKAVFRKTGQQFNQPVPLPEQKKGLQISFPGVREAICVAAGKKPGMMSLLKFS